MRADLPTGTVTFLFTDIEGSTRLLRDLGPDAYGEALAEHRRALRAAFAANGGVEVDTQGDAFLVAFPTARGARGWERRRAERAGRLIHETDAEFVAGVQEGRRLDVWDAAAIALGEDETET